MESGKHPQEKMTLDNFTLFDECDRKAVVGSLSPEEVTLLSSINEIIGFMNNYHLKKLKVIVDAKNDFLSDKKHLPHATAYTKLLHLEADTENRRQFMHLMVTEQERLMSALTNHWQNKRTNGLKISDEQIKDKQIQLQKLFAQFPKGRFAYLSADELSAVARTVDVLIAIIQYALQHTVKNASLSTPIRHQLDELLKSRTQIKECMMRHIEVYDKNKANMPPKPETQHLLSDSVAEDEVLSSMIMVEGSRDGLDNSILQDDTVRELAGSMLMPKKGDMLATHNDILLDPRLKINNLFDREMVKADLDVWVDQSLEYALPQLPFDDATSTHGTVLAYFNAYILTNGVEPALQNGIADYLVKQGLELSKVVGTFLGSIAINSINKLAETTVAAVEVVKETAVAATEVVREAANDTYNYYYDPATYWIKHYEKAIAPVINHKQAAEKAIRDKMIENCKMHRQIQRQLRNKSQSNNEHIVEVEDTQQELDLAKWQVVLSELVCKLRAEANETKLSCFSLYSTTNLKEKKAEVLNGFLDAIKDGKTLFELSCLAERTINTNQEATKGWYSRTEEVLVFIRDMEKPEKLQLSNFNELADWKSVIKDLKISLENELENIKNENSRTAIIKNKKIEALKALEGATDMQSLRNFAQDVMTKNKDACKGFTSRTEEVLKFIIKRKDPRELQRNKPISHIYRNYPRF